MSVRHSMTYFPAFASMHSVKPIHRLFTTACRSCRIQARQQRRSLSTSKDPEVYDVVCVGGGPAGLSVLAALRSHASTMGLKVALIESQSLAPSRAFSLPSTQYSNRCSSLTPASVSFLDRIGAWQHIQRSRVQPYEEMQVWDGISGARIEFDWDGNGSVPREGKTIAYMTENLNLTSALLKRVEELGGVDVFEGTKVDGIELGEESEHVDLRSWPVVRLSSGKTLAARLLIGADGGNSPVRTFAGIESKGWDYDRHGVVATMQMEGSGWNGDGGKIAYQRFLPTGPAAMLPMPGSHSTLVWSTLPQHAAHLKSLSPDDFTAMVNAAFRLSPVDLKYLHTLSSGQAEEVAWRIQHTPFEPSLLPQICTGVQDGTRASFPLKMRHADTYIGERVALLGDAAHTIHPLAGQGLNQGQGDVESLFETIRFAAEHGMDIGDMLSLERYGNDRYLKNHVLLGVVDKLHKIYATQNPVVVGVRSLGLRAVNMLSPVKGFFMGQAAGTGTKLF